MNKTKMTDMKKTKTLNTPLKAITLCLLLGFNSVYAANTQYGNNITINGDGNVAVGENITINGNNSVAIGDGSTVDEDNVVSVGDAQTSLFRRITNIEAGQNLNDAVNMAQYISLNETLQEAIMLVKQRPMTVSVNDQNAPEHLMSQTNNVNFWNPDGNVKLDMTFDNYYDFEDMEYKPSISFTLNDDIHINNSIKVGDKNNQASDILYITNNAIDNLATIQDISDPAVQNKAVNVETLNQAIQGFDTSLMVKYDDNTKTSITLGDNTTTRITNLTAGDISQNSTDAINGSQVYGMLDSVKTVLGGNATVNDNTISMSNVGNTGQNTVHDAIKYLNDNQYQFNVATNGQGITNVARNSTVNLINGKNINITNNGTDITIGTNDALSAQSLSIDNSAVVLDQNGLNLGMNHVDNMATVTDISDVGNQYKGVNVETLNNALNNITPTDTSQFVKYDSTAKDKVTLAGTDGTTIDNVKDGLISATSEEAINGSQVYGMLDSVKTVLGGNATVTDNTISMSNVGNTGQNTVHDAIKYLNDNQYQFNVATNGQNVTNVGRTETVDFVNGKNINISNNGTTITVSTNDALTAQSLSIDNSTVVLDQNGLNLGMNYVENMATVADISDVANKYKGVNVETLNNALANINTGGGTPIDTSKFVQYDSVSKDKITLAGNGGTIIDNVKDGEISATSKEAINGSQLNTVKEQVETNRLNIEHHQEEINLINGLIADGWDVLADAGQYNMTLGDQVHILGGTGGNINTSITNDKLYVNLNPDISVNSVTTGNVVMNQNGLSLDDKKITNLGNGEISATSTEAINGSQVYGMLDSVKTVLGGNASVNDNTISMSNVGNTGKDTIHDAIEYINNKQVSGGYSFNIAANNQNAKQIAGDETVSFNSGKNMVVSREGNNINIATNDNLVAETLTVGQTGVVVSGSGIDLKNTAINNMQTVDNIYDNTNDGKGVNVETLRNNLVAKVDQGTGNVTIGGEVGGDVVRVSNVEDKDRRVTGVANAVYDNDAVNYGQLKALTNKVDENDKDNRAGIAGALAAASLPQSYMPGTKMTSVAMGNYKGASALAIGHSAISDNGKHTFRFNANINTRNDIGVGAGYGYMW